MAALPADGGAAANPGLSALLRQGYLSETQALLARLGVSIPPASAARIDTTMRALKSMGLAYALDGLWIFAADNRVLARQNYIADQYNITEVNSPTFTAFQGYKSDGATSYLTTNFNPATATNPRWTQNSAFLMIWSGTNITDGGWDCGSDVAGDTSGINSRSSTASELRCRPGPNGSNAAQNFTGDGTSLGMFSQSRTGSGGGTVYQRASSAGTHAIASTAVQNANITICRAQTSLYSNREIRAAAVGGGLSAAQVYDLYRILSAHLSSVGAFI